MEQEKSQAELDELIDGSRRSFMKKGVLASSALALGVGGSGVVGAEGSVQQPTQTLMFAYDYHPGRSLQVVARLQQRVTREVLGQEVGDDGDPVVSDTSEWSVYIANSQMDGGDVPGEYVLLFTRNGQLGDQVQLGTSATFFSDELNLLEVTVESDGGGDGGTPTPEDGTPTPEDGTPTPEDGTPTPEDGTPTPEEDS